MVFLNLHYSEATNEKQLLITFPKFINVFHHDGGYKKKEKHVSPSFQTQAHSIELWEHKFIFMWKSEIYLFV